ncbi:MAG: DNA replication and repair protein RecF [Coriobacteriales bacterium]|jgi:DNA replication and repair protein RecF|nr:DNA replication and repair protein RecF [Coriobacteriales bacterium]
MQIKSIELINFRNHKYLRFEPTKALVIVVGDNTVGKTNLVEALQLLSMQYSFRHPTGYELVHQQQTVGEAQNTKNCKGEENGSLENSRIDCKIAIEYSNFREEYDAGENSSRACLRGATTICMRIIAGERRFFVNDKQRSRLDMAGLLPAVLFSPDDLGIAKGPPLVRRELLDNLGARISKTFASIKSDYNRALKQKNLLLKEGYVDPDILESWNQNLAKLGASLFTHRVNLFLRLMDAATRIYADITNGEELTALYVPSHDEENPTDVASGGAGFDTNTRSFHKTKEKNNTDSQKAPDQVVRAPVNLTTSDVKEQLLQTMNNYQQRETGARRSLIGPHRDDIIFFLNGQDVRRYGSQGQQRSVALALKMAEIEVFKDVLGLVPMLLLDDVMSELDANRRAHLMQQIDRYSQTFITTTNLGYFDEQTLRSAHLLRLPLKS